MAELSIAQPIMTCKHWDCLEYNPTTGEFIWTQRLSNRIKIGDVAGWRDVHGYIKIKIKGIHYYAHRLAYFFMTGTWPSQIDHINNIRNDNRWENLREVTCSVNNRERPLTKANKSGIAGVSWDAFGGSWRATFNDKKLGRYTEWWDAVCARKSAEALLL